MDYECTLREIEAQPIMSIRGPTTTAAIATLIGEFLGEVWNHRIDRERVDCAPRPMKHPIRET